MFSAPDGGFVGKYMSLMNITEKIEFIKRSGLWKLLQFCGRFGQA